jgi:hypothetical protein
MFFNPALNTLIMYHIELKSALGLNKYKSVLAVFSVFIHIIPVNFQK